MIGRCVANRPYMYLPLKGDTNDYSVNAQNPSNTSVTTTTGIFGESNGAYTWNASGDKLSWSSSVGNTIATALNNNATIIHFIKINGYNGVSDPNIILYQYSGAGSAESSFYTAYADDASIRTAKRSGGGANVLTFSSTGITTSTWYNFASVFSGNDLEFFLDTVSKSSGTFNRIAYTSSTNPLVMGGFSGTNWFNADIVDYRVYNASLSKGSINIINNEKGRIRA